MAIFDLKFIRALSSSVEKHWQIFSVMAKRNTSGNPEGYVLRVEGSRADPVYCVLGEGALTYYSMKGGKELGETELTGYKLAVNYLENKRNDIPNRILIRLVPKRVNGESGAAATGMFTFFSSSEAKKKNHSIILAPSTRELQVEWATAILNWHKHCWEDPITLFSYKDEYEALECIMKQYGKQRQLTKGVVPKQTSIVQPINKK